MKPTWVDEWINEPNVAVVIMVAWGFLLSYPLHRLIQRRDRVYFSIVNALDIEPPKQTKTKSDTLVFKYDETLKKTDISVSDKILNKLEVLEFNSESEFRTKSQFAGLPKNKKNISGWIIVKKKKE
jgi:hypothetical protein